MDESPTDQGRVSSTYSPNTVLVTQPRYITKPRRQIQCLEQTLAISVFYVPLLGVRTQDPLVGLAPVNAFPPDPCKGPSSSLPH